MKPFTSQISLPVGLLSPHTEHIKRTLTSMRGQYLDETAFESLHIKGDLLIYEVYANNVPDNPGELQHGISIVHPGKVGLEYFMTKGHFHNVLDTAEVYYCLHGHGYMMMENLEGEWAAEELLPGVVLYVPPCWAHRSINVGDDDLITFFVFPGHAGHDYKTIETKGFRRLIIERDGKPVIIDNPKWANE